MADDTTTEKPATPAAPVTDATPKDTPADKPAVDTKPAGAGDTAPADGTPPTAAETPAGPPAKYALVVPPNSETWLDATDITTLEGRAKTLGWSNEQAQRALEMTAQQRQAESRAFRDQIEADPEYGGDHLGETQTHANLALDRVRPAGTPRGDAIRQLLTKIGYGNHPEVVSLLADLGKLMAEDQPAHGAPGRGTPRDAAAVLYGGSTK
jgi:hypothetical protein